jgi:hypothetical protein
MQAGHTWRYIYMKRVEVGVIATPGNRLSVCRKYDSCNVFDGAGGAMIAGDPLGRREGVRPRLYGEVYLCVVELPWSLCEVCHDADWCLLRHGGKAQRECGEECYGDTRHRQGESSRRELDI